LTPGEDEPFATALPLRFRGAIHWLALAGRAPDLARHYPSAGGTPGPTVVDDFLATVARLQDEIESRIHLAVQTNEVGRSGGPGTRPSAVPPQGYVRRVPGEWDPKTERWLRWARTPGFDAYWYCRGAFFDSIVPSCSATVAEVPARASCPRRSGGERVRRVRAWATPGPPPLRLPHPARNTQIRQFRARSTAHRAFVARPPTFAVRRCRPEICSYLVASSVAVHPHVGWPGLQGRCRGFESLRAHLDIRPYSPASVSASCHSRARSHSGRSASIFFDSTCAISRSRSGSTCW
jgi:hypothetical protein